jgi:hypothetical protein
MLAAYLHKQCFNLHSITSKQVDLMMHYYGFISLLIVSNSFEKKKAVMSFTS